MKAGTSAISVGVRRRYRQGRRVQRGRGRPKTFCGAHESRAVPPREPRGHRTKARPRFYGADTNGKHVSARENGRPLQGGARYDFGERYVSGARDAARERGRKPRIKTTIFDCALSGRPRKQATVCPKWPAQVLCASSGPGKIVSVCLKSFWQGLSRKLVKRGH